MHGRVDDSHDRHRSQGDGQGHVHQGQEANGGGQQFYCRRITDNGAGTAPAPLMRDRRRSSGDRRVGRGLRQGLLADGDGDADGELVMYDWTPTALKFSGTWPGCSTAPFVFGFAMAAGVGEPGGDGGVHDEDGAGYVEGDGEWPPDLHRHRLLQELPVSSDCQCAQDADEVPSGGARRGRRDADDRRHRLRHADPGHGTAGYRYFSPIPATAGAGALTGTVAPPAVIRADRRSRGRVIRGMDGDDELFGPKPSAPLTSQTSTAPALAPATDVRAVPRALGALLCALGRATEAEVARVNAGLRGCRCRWWRCAIWRRRRRSRWRRWCRPRRARACWR